MAFNSVAIVFSLLSALFICGLAQENTSQINLGSKLSPNSSQYPTSWSSRSGKFKFGFYHQGSGFAIGIWLEGKDSITVVWTANRDDPPISSSTKATLVLDQSGLLLELEVDDDDHDHRPQPKVIPSTNNSVTSACMDDSGNFVLYNHSLSVWESFQHPTDTLLGGQALSTGSQLFSSVSETDRSTGRFHLKMQNDCNLVLYPINNEDTKSDAYWSTHTWKFAGFKCYLYLNNTAGDLFIMNSANSTVVKRLRSLHFYSSLDDDQINQTGRIYRATLEPNGIFKLYSYDIDDNSGGKFKEPELVWWALENACEVKGFCGLNSFCTFLDDQPNCLCLPGSDFADSTKQTLGCLRNYTDVACIDGKENTTIYDMEEMENIMWEDMGYDEESGMSREECKKSCLEDCNCGATLFERNSCKKQKLPLRYVRRESSKSPSPDIIAFFKVGKNTTNQTHVTNPSSTDMTTIPPREQQAITTKKDLTQVIVLALGLVIFSCVSIAISCLYIFKIRVLRYKRLRDIKGQFGLILLTDQGHDEELTLRVFSYSELKRATNGFKEELGRGSFGAVYRGSLNKGRKLVAVKRLEKLIDEGEREFRAEMRAIVRTNHKNLVRLMGYCTEHSKRLLVYEYMSNGSLADLLFKQVSRPYWEARVRIAIDVAKGIHYLHEECKSPIIHCDIKPQNILMDDFWTPKISDFGLAKLLMPDQTRTFTGVRGTRGYLAPEWQKNTPITVKADVYSYGIVLMEIICCRRNLEANVPNVEEIVLSSFVYKCFVDRELDKLVVGEDQVDRRTLENMVKVALWCIQDEAVLRPSMKSVALMLEGITDICSPPCPTSASM